MYRGQRDDAAPASLGVAISSDMKQYCNIMLLYGINGHNMLERGDNPPYRSADSLAPHQRRSNACTSLSYQERVYPRTSVYFSRQSRPVLLGPRTRILVYDVGFGRRIE